MSECYLCGSNKAEMYSIQIRARLDTSRAVALQEYVVTMNIVKSICRECLSKVPGFIENADRGKFNPVLGIIRHRIDAIEYQLGNLMQYLSDRDSRDVDIVEK